MSVFVFDNSVLTKLRSNGRTPIDDSLLLFFDDVMRKYSVDLERVLISPKSFVEIINLGKIRFEIEREGRSEISSENKIIVDLIYCESDQSEDVIVKFLNFLNNFFQKSFRKKLSQKLLLEYTKHALEEYKFVNNFSVIETQVKRIAQNLAENVDEYDRFIAELVEDSVIRFALASIDMNRIPTSSRESGFELSNAIIRVLMLRFRNYGIFGSNLILISSDYKYKIETAEKKQERIDRLIRVKDDIADGEHAEFALVGLRCISSNSLIPVTVFTCEPLDTIYERLKYTFQGIGTKAENIHPQTLCFGRTVKVDFDTRSIHEIDSGTYINSTFRSVGGGPLYTEISSIS